MKNRATVVLFSRKHCITSLLKTQSADSGPIRHHNLLCLTLLLTADVIQIHFVVSAGYGIIVRNARKSGPRRSSERDSNLEHVHALARQVQV